MKIDLKKIEVAKEVKHVINEYISDKFYIAGGFALQTMLGRVFTNDVDVYVPIDMDNFKRYSKILTRINCTFRVVGRAYDDTDLMLALEYVRQGEVVQIMFYDKNKSIEDIVDTFDINLCKVYMTIDNSKLEINALPAAKKGLDKGILRAKPRNSKLKSKTEARLSKYARRFPKFKVK